MTPQSANKGGRYDHPKGKEAVLRGVCSARAADLPGCSGLPHHLFHPAVAYQLQWRRHLWQSRHPDCGLSQLCLDVYRTHGAFLPGTGQQPADCGGVRAGTDPPGVYPGLYPFPQTDQPRQQVLPDHDLSSQCYLRHHHRRAVQCHHLRAQLCADGGEAPLQPGRCLHPQPQPDGAGADCDTVDVHWVLHDHLSGQPAAH